VQAGIVDTQAPPRPPATGGPQQFWRLLWKSFGRLRQSNRYRAFMSYSHAVDDHLAPAIQSALHRFAKPWYRLRAIRVFRDRTSLSATPRTLALDSKGAR
jgi:hypothetical protein